MDYVKKSKTKSAALNFELRHLTSDFYVNTVQCDGFFSVYINRFTGIVSHFKLDNVVTNNETSFEN